MKPSRRSMEAWVREIGDRPMLCMAEENGWVHRAPREAEVARRAELARRRARGRRTS